MMQLAVDIRVQKLSLLVLALTTLIITPNITLDSVNLPKILSISIIAFTILGVLFVNWTDFKDSVPPALLVAILLLLGSLISSFITNGPTTSQFFGSWGRNSGILTFLGLIIIMLASAVVGHRDFSKKLLATVVLVSIINTSYGLAQFFGLDPVDWQTSAGPVVGTLGNPNFLSALLGLGSTASLAFILGQTSTKSRALLSIFLVLQLIVMFYSESIQGIMIFAIAAIILMFLRYLRTSKKWIKGSYWLVLILLSSLITVGLIGKGPLSTLLFESSIRVRTFYWGAAWDMATKNPLTGVGIDRFGDFYRESRSSEAATVYGPDLFSNSAHNYFLDLAAYAGFPALFAYLFLVLLIFRSAINIIWRTKSFDVVGSGLVCTWAAFTVQSLISVNQIGVAIWGWALGGAVIGYDRFLMSEAEFGKDKREAIEASLSANTVVATFLGFMAGLFIAIWPFQRDIEFANALKARDAVRIEKAATGWPVSSFYLSYASEIFLANQFNEESLSLAERATRVNERDFLAWKLIYTNPNATKKKQGEALLRMRKLDPLNQNLPLP